VTNHPDHVDSILTAIDRACNDYPLVGASISGIHLEGPFISPEDGSRGAHPKEFVVAPDWNLVARWQKAAGGRIRMLTMSPEWPGAADFITRCRANGITVAIGHTSATSEQISGAVAAGARLSTHLGNGAHAMLPRHPNYIWQQLANDELWVSVIADGFHLPDAVLKAFSRVKGNRLFLVSDSTHLAGMPPGTYQTHIGGAVTLTPDGCLQMATDPGHLAGSAQSLLRGVWNLYSKRLATLAQAWEMASPRPAAFMELAAGRLAAAAPADIVRFALTDNGLSVLQAVKDGQIVYERSIASDTVETPEIRSAFPLACQRGTRDSRTSGD
jgi:N-acetylglucosamine-6-phosphate deacetylase